MKILVLDDDKIDRESIRRLIRKSETKAEIIDAATLEEGLLQVSRHNFDVILMDWHLPDGCGIDAVNSLRSQIDFNDSAIIMMSTSEDDHLARLALESGAQDFLHKSEISLTRLQHAIVHAQTRNELESKLKKSYDNVKQLAENDTLTGLSNRYKFDKCLKNAISSCHRESRQKVALLLIDLDRFKFINDTYGHDSGDSVLIKITRRIQSCLRGEETFARLGGDEFAIILNGEQSNLAAGQVATRIKHIMAKPIYIEELELQLSVSIGISVFPDNADSADELNKQADIAMYRSKENGRNKFHFFEQDMHEQFAARFLLEQQLTKAIREKSFILHYQPCHSIETGELVGVEALVRWKKPTGHLVYPTKFIPIIEDNRQIIELGGWIIEQALLDITQFNKHSTKPIIMAINLSPIQIQNDNFLNGLKYILKKVDVDPSMIEFELTESTFFANTLKVQENLNVLNRMGFRFALDDFGTGFSSIAHLRDYHLHTVKIDRSLIKDLVLNQKNQALLNGLVYMIHTLGLDAVAEGIETEEELTFCQSLNIKTGQGYYFSKPINKKAIVQYIQKKNKLNSIDADRENIKHNLKAIRAQRF